MTTRTDDEIRSSVSRAYGNRVRPVLEAANAPATAEGAACCGPDCCSTEAVAPLKTIQLIDITPTATAEACCDITAGNDCCGPDAESEVQIVQIAKLYARESIADLPSTVTDVAFGCGNPTAIAALQPGETVLDLGSGGGIDCFLAAKMVGETGRVFGVDMTPEMVALARKNAGKVGATNVEFRLGEIEHLPIDANTVDVIISNCVINLSPDKDQVFREAFRALKPGGRLQVSDVVWTKPVPQEVKDDLEKWAGCIAGALLESEYLEKIGAAGFDGVTSVATEYPGGKGIASANVVAYKPRA
ncbi:MAG: arsenite methyltransferase [Dehalococcoidia bacterium]